jgi:CHAT domain-containing protein
MGWYLPPQVELLTLSACRTAVGDEQVELGFAGLAVQAGVKSALASLWYLSDRGTLALMSGFYQQLRQPDVTIKAEALRRVQIAMLRGQVRQENGQLQGVEQLGGIPLPPQLAAQGDQDFSHPYYWAGFTMIGSPW